MPGCSDGTSATMNTSLASYHRQLIPLNFPDTLLEDPYRNLPSQPCLLFKNALFFPELDRTRVPRSNNTISSSFQTHVFEGFLLGLHVC